MRLIFYYGKTDLTVLFIILLLPSNIIDSPATIFVDIGASAVRLTNRVWNKSSSLLPAELFWRKGGILQFLFGF